MNLDRTTLWGEVRFTRPGVACDLSSGAGNCLRKGEAGEKLDHSGYHFTNARSAQPGVMRSEKEEGPKWIA